MAGEERELGFQKGKGTVLTPTVPPRTIDPFAASLPRDLLAGFPRYSRSRTFFSSVRLRYGSKVAVGKFT